MTGAEYNLFYDGTNPNSFQSAYIQSLQDISTTFGCQSSASNCSEWELADLQWGSSTISQYSPADVTIKNLFPASNSVFTSYGIYTKPVEYYQYEALYVKKGNTIPKASVGTIFNNMTGINSELLATMFIIQVSSGDAAQL